MGGRGKKEGQVTGYKYSMGLHMGLCRGPIDSLVEIRVGDITAWPVASISKTGGGTSTIVNTVEGDLVTNYVPPTYADVPKPDPVTVSSTIEINAPKLFGGETKEGGIVGTLAVMMGEATQGQNEGLVAMLKDSLIGAFRGVVTLFYDGEVASNNPYPKPWKFRVRRALQGWDGEVFYPEAADIIHTVTTPSEIEGEPDVDHYIHSMNAVHIIYECLTNREWGRGLPREMIDTQSFIYAADVAYCEYMGLCIPWARQDTVEAFTQRIVDHLGAVIYPSKETGLLKIRLIRDDYDVGSLSTYSTDNGLLELREDEQSSPETLINEVIVSYVDPIARGRGQTRVQNIGVMQAVGAVNSKSVDYLGIPTRSLANRVAQRDLRIHSAVLRRFSLKMNRQAWRLSPGDVFKLSDTRRGIASIVVRVGAVEDSEDGSLAITAVQDVFGLPASSYISAPPNVVITVTKPTLAQFSTICEASYWDLVRRIPSSYMDSIIDTETYVYLMGAKPLTGVSANYGIATGTPTTEMTIKGNGSWTPAGALTANMSASQTNLFVTVGSLPSTIAVGSPGQVDNEIIRIDAYNYATGEVTISRGCVDTIPKPHALGSAFWVLGAGYGLDKTKYTQSEEVWGKVLTNTLSGQLHISLATQVSLTTVARHVRPYPPAKVRIDGGPFADATLAAAGFTVTWVHRNRITQNDVLLHQQNSSVTSEAGVTYTIKIRLQSDNSVIRTVTGLTGETWTYASGDWATDGSQELIYLDLYSVRDGWDSWQFYHIPLQIKALGWGMNWGNNWGGS